MTKTAAFVTLAMVGALCAPVEAENRDRDLSSSLANTLTGIGNTAPRGPAMGRYSVH